jgi:hypothetical protein
MRRSDTGAAAAAPPGSESTHAAAPVRLLVQCKPFKNAAIYRAVSEGLAARNFYPADHLCVMVPGATNLGVAIRSMGLVLRRRISVFAAAPSQQPSKGPRQTSQRPRSSWRSPPCPGQEGLQPHGRLERSGAHRRGRQAFASPSRHPSAAAGHALSNSRHTNEFGRSISTEPPPARCSSLVMGAVRGRLMAPCAPPTNVWPKPMSSRG